ncbi:MAG: hypothetical protein GF315_02615 [candidate division Zixibacteria bacterium]|nr:hypothetical protein [candidate division Zixibacteria bacterium]
MITELSSTGSFRQYLHSLYEDVACFIFPPYCIICKTSLEDGKQSVCSQCLEDIMREIKGTDPYCPVCEKQYPDIFDRCRRCSGRNSPGKLYALVPMTPHIREYLHAYKYFGRLEIAEDFARRAFEMYNDAEFVQQIDVIVPVPLHRRKRLQRGYNQAEVFACHLSELFGTPLANNSLKRIKHTKSQTYLNAKQRFENVKGVFRIIDGKQIRNKRVLLVDDIVTTGATLYECSRTLKKAGATTVVSFTIGRPVIKD